jgi:hypothetical protein
MKSSEVVSKAVKAEYLMAKASAGRGAKEKAPTSSKRNRDAEANLLVFIAILGIGIVSFLLNYFLNV